MKKTAALMISVCCLLSSSCGLSQDRQQKRPEGFSIIPSKIIQIQIPADLPQPYLDGAREMVAQVARLSNETVYIELKEVALDEDLNFAVTELMLVPHKIMSGMSNEMKTIGMPFVFNSSAHLTESLNADRIMAQLGNSIKDNGVRPLLAMSGADPLLVNVGTPILSVYDFQKALLYIHEDSIYMKNALQLLNVQVTLFEKNENLAERISPIPINDGAINTMLIAESSMEEMRNYPDKELPISVIWSMHRPNPYWLVAGNSFWEGLNQYEQDLLLEGISYMAGTTEQKLQTMRSSFSEEMEQRGITVQYILRKDFGNVLYESPINAEQRRQLLPAFQPSFYHQLQSFI